MKIDKRFLKFTRSWLGEDSDKTDIESEWDNKLTLRENIEQFKLKHFKQGEYDRELAKTQEEQIQEYQKEQLEELKAQKDKEIEQDKRTVIEYYKEVYDTIRRFGLKSNKINLLMVKGRGGIGKCLLPSTKIDTPRGILELKDIREGDYVYGYDFKTNKIKPTRVIQKQKSVKNELIVIETDRRKIISSLEHGFYTSKGWVKAKDLNISNTIYVYGSSNGHIRRMGIYSRDNRWRRQFDDSPTQETTPKNERELCGFKVTHNHIKFRYKPHEMVKNEVTIRRNPINATFEIQQKIPQTNISVLSQEPLQNQDNIGKYITTPYYQEGTGYFNVGICRAKIISESQEGTRQTIYSRGLQDLLVNQETQLNTERITKCYKISREQTTLFDIATTLTNFFAEGILVHNSWHIRKALVKYKLDYKELQTVTEAVLPEMLHTYSDKVLWLKDVVKIFNSPNAIDIIKAATETETIKDDSGHEGRLICVNKYSNELRKAGVPKEFMFYGSIVFDFNKLSHSHYIEDFNALKSRGYDVTIIFDIKRTAKLMRLICKSKEELEVTNYLIKHYKHHHSFNLRTQQKAFNTYYCAKELKQDWKAELKYELDKSRTEVQEYLYEFIGDSVVSKADLIRWVRQGKQYAQTNRTARRRVDEWLEDGEIYLVSKEKYNPDISLSPDVTELTKRQ